MIELDEYYWAMNTIIENRIRFSPTDPGEIRLVYMELNLIKSDASMLLTEISDE